MKRGKAWLLMSSLAIVMSVYALLLLVAPATRPPFLRERVLGLPLAVMAHLAGGAASLALGPFQLSERFRSASIRRHRHLGRAYLASVLVGGVAGLRLSVVSQGGWFAHLGFAVLGALWLLSASAAYLAIRRGQRVQHRAWMYRNFALTFAAVTLRIYLPLSLLLGCPFATAYPTIAWLCWLPNLLVAELYFVRGAHPSSQYA